MSYQTTAVTDVVAAPLKNPYTPSGAQSVASDPPISGHVGTGDCGQDMIGVEEEVYEPDELMPSDNNDVLRLVLAKLSAMESQNRELFSEVAVLRRHVRDLGPTHAVTVDNGGQGSKEPHRDMDCDESPVKTRSVQAKRPKGASDGPRPRLPPPETVLKAGGNVRRWLDEWANYFGTTGIRSGQTRLALGKLDHPLWGEVGRRFGVSLPSDADSIPWEDFSRVVGYVVKPTGSDFTIEADQERLYIMYRGSLAENVKLFMGRFLELDQQRDRPMAIDNLLRLLIKKLPKPLAATIKFTRTDGSPWEHAAELLAVVLEEAVRQDTIADSQQNVGHQSQQERPQQHQQQQQQHGSKWGKKRKAPWHQNKEKNFNNGKKQFGGGNQGQGGRQRQDRGSRSWHGNERHNGQQQQQNNGNGK